MSESKNYAGLGMEALARTAYWKWVAEQDLPIVQGFGVEDLAHISLAPWNRLGGNAAFVHLYGMQGVTGIYVGEIAPGAALKPEKHLYEEVICILSGRGSTAVWHDGGSKQWFEWDQWSIFAPPLNAWHQLVNGGNQPVRFMAYTNAPIVMDIFRDPEFVFRCDHQFTSRYDAREGYFSQSDRRYEIGRSNIWETNLISNAETAIVEGKELKGEGAQITQFEMVGNSLIGHIAQWPVGRYHKAHHHGPGAVLLAIRSEGTVLMWPREAGVRPYESGRRNDVVEIPWKPGGIFCPPGGWFHQHFNTGPEPARMVAFRFGSRLNPVGFHVAAKQSEEGHYTSIREGGTMIEYEDEDPEIRRAFAAALREKNIPLEMTEVRYREASGISV